MTFEKKNSFCAILAKTVFEGEFGNWQQSENSIGT